MYPKPMMKENGHWQLLLPKRVMDMDGGQRYTLHTVGASSSGAYVTPELPEGVPTETFPNGAGRNRPFEILYGYVNGETYSTQNKELIWARNSGEVAEYTRQSFPGSHGRI